MQIKRFSANHPVRAALALVLIALLLRILDYFVIRTDELIGEQLLSKVGGLVLVFAYAWIVKGDLGCVGFHAVRWRTSVALGLVFMAVGLAAGYGAEWLYLQLAGEGPRLVFAASSHPVIPEDTATSGLLLGFILVLGNVINSAMEEGLFRGICVTHFGTRMSLTRANLMQAALFGAWHITVPIRAYLDGQISLAMAGVTSLVYVFGSGAIGYVWGYYYAKTNSIWTSWSAHALNNTTMNFLQVVAIVGTPSTMALRVIVVALVEVGLLPLFKQGTNRLNMPTVVTWLEVR
jgi:membrane protease YdiL (CAAX protease family)